MALLADSTAEPAPLPLSGCIVSMSGALPGRRTQAGIERDYLKVLGASLSKEVTSSTTHLVSSEAYYKRHFPKVLQAEEYGIPIVTFYWLEDSLKHNKRMDEEEYRFNSSTPKSLTDSCQKRQLPDDDENNDDALRTKRAQSTKAEIMREDVKVGEAQIAKTRNVTVPLDEGAEHDLPGYEVYIDKNGVIYDASLNLASNSNNMNKFYRLQLLRSVGNKFYCRVRWGRVGVRGTTKIHGDGTEGEARYHFNAKFQDKTGLSWVNRAHPPRPKKYIFIERSYDVEREEESDDQVGRKSRLAKPVQELMKLIFNQHFFAATMAELNYNSTKLPLGQLSKWTITRGYEALTNLSALLNNPCLATTQYHTTFDSAVEDLSNLYFSLIPHVFGRNKPPIIKDLALLKKEIELLESLSDMKDAQLLMKEKEEKEKDKLHPTDQQFNSLGLDEMTVLDSRSQEFLELKDLLLKTQGATHQVNYEISQIFRISRQGEKERLEGTYSPPQNRRLLWHGSRCTNFGGILSQGLRIAPPEAPVNGYSMSLFPS